MRQYGGFAKFLLAIGEGAVTALKSLEARSQTLTLFNLRIFENLHSQSSKEETLLLLQDKKAKWADIEKGVNDIIHRQWCQYIWERHPDISNEKRMPDISLQ